MSGLTEWVNDIFNIIFMDVNTTKVKLLLDSTHNNGT